nr:ribonuclease H-like domain, reverse transcriptase, RNA-dependent DNA polymerase [Tanacetum cinerariifolium]
MTLEEAIGRLKTYEERIKYKKGKQVDNQEKLMFTQHENKGKYFRGRGRGKHKFSQGRNHDNFKKEKKEGETSHRSYNKNNFKKSSYDTSKLRCYKCKKLGHISPDCPLRIKTNEQSNLVEEDLEQTLLMAILEDEEERKVSLHEKDVGYKETNKDSLWYFDNGASNHMTEVREHFKELDEEVSGKVTFRDGSYRDKRKSVPIKALEDINPYEAIKRRKPNLENLRIFGCIAYAKVPSQHLTKLDDRSTKMVYLGNEQGSKAYRLFDPTTQMVCVSRDVKFKGDEAWDWKDYMSEHINDEPEWTDFKIGNLKVLNEHHDQGFQPIEEDNEFPNNDDDDYASPTRYSPLHSQTPHTINTIIKIRGFRTLNDLYENTEELLLAEDEPRNYKEASSDQKWIEATKVELDSINRNITWELTTLPKGHKAIGLKWVFKTKKDVNKNIIRHKARLVAKCYIPQHGIDFEEVFAPEERMETVCLLLPIATNNKWERQDNGKVYRLIKALYGLRQAPRAWNIKLDNTLKSLNFKKCALEQAIYTKTSKDSTLLIGVYVDDLIITGTLKEEIDKFQAQMKEKFKIRTRLTKVTEGTMVNSTEYRSLIGCLRYLLHTRPDLCYSVGLLSRFMQEPREQHMKAIRQVLRYVKGTKGYGITYKHNEGNKIHGYSDSSYRINTQERKGTTGIIFYYGESPISWSTQKQATVALSSYESEFIPATQALWLKRLLSKLTHYEEDKVTKRVNNKSAIALMKNPIFHRRSKHIDTKYHFIRECIEKENILVEFVSGEYQRADILTKALPKIKFLTMRHLIGLKDLSHNVCD